MGTKTNPTILCGACDNAINPDGEAILFQQHDRNNFARYTFTHVHADCANVFDDWSHLELGHVKLPVRP